MKQSAVFDASGRYRYWLEREWAADLPRLGFVMLNPNRADAEQDDPTIRRCLGFARDWHYGAIAVVNLFAYCTAQPRDLRRVANPIGAENDDYLIKLGQQVDRVVLAWGNGGSWGGRDRAAVGLLSANIQSGLYCLGQTQRGQPKHPLYLKRDTLPIRMAGADER